jgi:hypothetical protein
LKWNFGINLNTVEPITEAGFDFIAGGQTRIFNPTDVSHQKDHSFSAGVFAILDAGKGVSFRLKVKRTSYVIDEIYNFMDMVPYSSSTYLIDDGHFRQNVIDYMPGVTWGIGYRKMNFYCGVQGEWRQYGPISLLLNYTNYTTATNAMQDVKTYSFKQPGGFSIGAGPLAGFSVTFLKRFSAGAEFSSAFSYYKTGGKRTLDTITAGFTEHSSVDNSFEAFKFSSVNTSFNLSFRL